jgi:hypothetical protein
VAALLCISAWATYQMGPSLLAHQLGLRRPQFTMPAVVVVAAP